jgi:bacterial/archaeal transporter family protein
MWILFAFGSALFSGATAILAKCGIRNTDSNVVTALRTVVVLLFSWLMVWITGSFSTLTGVSTKTFVFLILSGIATGASWLCYFKALQTGDVNKVTPVDKTSTILTMLLAFVFLGEKLTVWKAAAMLLIGIGTWLMIQKKNVRQSVAVPAEKNASWFMYAVGSSVFAALTSILGKVGIEGINSTLGTAVRTIVVLIMAWIVVFVTKKQHEIKTIDRKSLLFIVLSGFATGSAWLCYYRALQTGPASVVVPIDKLSILVTVVFAYFVFGERLQKKSVMGLTAITAGTLLLLK